MRFGLPSVNWRFLGREIYVSFAGRKISGKQMNDSTVSFYCAHALRKPWKKWFLNPVFENRSYMDSRFRTTIFFIFLWHIVEVYNDR